METNGTGRWFDVFWRGFVILASIIGFISTIVWNTSYSHPIWINYFACTIVAYALLSWVSLPDENDDHFAWFLFFFLFLFHIGWMIYFGDEAFDRWLNSVPVLKLLQSGTYVVVLLDVLGLLCAWSIFTAISGPQFEGPRGFIPFCLHLSVLLLINYTLLWLVLSEKHRALLEAIGEALWVDLRYLAIVTMAAAILVYSFFLTLKETRPSEIVIGEESWDQNARISFFTTNELGKALSELTRLSVNTVLLIWGYMWAWLIRVVRTAKDWTMYNGTHFVMLRFAVLLILLKCLHLLFEHFSVQLLGSFSIKPTDSFRANFMADLFQTSYLLIVEVVIGLALYATLKAAQVLDEERVYKAFAVILGGQGLASFAVHLLAKYRHFDSGSQPWGTYGDFAILAAAGSLILFGLLLRITLQRGQKAKAM